MVRKFEADRNGIVAEAEAFQIAKQDDCTAANLVLKTLRAKEKAITSALEEILIPQRKAIDALRQLKRDLLAPFEAGRRILTEKVMGWRAEENSRIALAAAKAEAEEQRRRKIQESHAQRGHEVSAPIEVPRPEPLAARDTTRTQTRCNYTVVNFGAVPDDYKELNRGAVRTAMGERDENGKPVTEIPGIEWVADEILIAG